MQVRFLPAGPRKQCDEARARTTLRTLTFIASAASFMVNGATTPEGVGGTIATRGALTHEMIARGPDLGSRRYRMSKIEDDELQDLLIVRASRTAAKELESTTKELESILQQKRSEPGHSLLKKALLEKQGELPTGRI
jgi:hypothetical protein